MQNSIYILIAAVTALLLALFQYIYKSKNKSRRIILLFILRFLTLFTLFLLLINPKFKSTTNFEEKPTLVLGIDNSESIAYLNKKDEVLNLIKNLQNNSKLRERFNIEAYTFGSKIESLDSLSFNERQSNMADVMKRAEDTYKDTNYSLLLISDGNQTYGEDYEFLIPNKAVVNTLIVGDTTKYLDLNIKQVNVNRYTYLKNEFPIEVFVNYSGIEKIQSKLEIVSGNQVLFSQTLDFDISKTSQIVSTTLNASQVGVKTFQAIVKPLPEERNTINNTKNFAIEVIDQKTNIALVSQLLHPDLGALKKAIETNEQRSVQILKPSELVSKVNDFQLIILYQPNNNFNAILQEVFTNGKNTLVITGAATDLSFLNASQPFYSQEITNQTEEYQPTLNVNYAPFIIDDLNFEDFPPLVSEFGDVTFKEPHETLLYKTINGINSAKPLLATFESESQKHALLLGEGLWKWRAQSYLDQSNFNGFDNFIGKLIQYLSSNKRRDRIVLDYNSFYNGNQDVIIKAQYFNKTFEFDSNASLKLRLKNKADSVFKDIPLLLNNNNYSVDLSGLEAGEYSFTISHATEPITASGEFQVLEYNVEQQFLNANVTKMTAISDKSNGKAYFMDDSSKMVSDLLNETTYATIQKQKTDVIPLIDWKYLLGFLVLTLSLEWFIRKYNGLI